ncbi:hypothetical protein BLNAU_3549 [Blattamonas nauphoetae]|uniref:Uncharacterized protein n=1 Tax=Blattamonas nauphoetae TaxID=2049346 RepID=A0ABQ9YCC6_9EUKA|nr:hypothetical protein BLNAU_3549 [Blattamonas nauphoetae]
MRDSYQVPDVQKLLDTRPAGMSIAEDRNRVIQTGGANLRSSDRPDIILPPVPSGSGRMGRARRQRTDDSPPQWTVPTERPSTPPRHFPEPVRHTSASPVVSQPLLQPITQTTPNTITINPHPSEPSASSLSPPLPTRKPIPRTSHPPTPPPTRKKMRKQETTTHSGSSQRGHPSSANSSFPHPPPRPSEEEQIFFDDIRNGNS